MENEKIADDLPSSGISSEVDFTKDGKQLGYLRLPHSVHRSAYGWLPIPIASIRNGSGPTAVLMAGNHGDEYEGQVLLSNLIRDLSADDVSGQVIILPMANFPAAQAGLRTSPIDDLNLNRILPGDPKGTPTQVIADYIENTLLTGVDLLVDLHSGGSSLEYLPTALARVGDTPEEQAEIETLLRVFGLPYSILYEEAMDAGSSEAGARRNGARALSTELGGAGVVTKDYVDMASDGVRRLLGYLGILSADVVPPPPPSDTRLMELRGNESYVYASEPGLFEPMVALDDEVQAGDLAGHIHFVETPGKPPLAVRFDAAGLIICKRAMAKCERGDCLFHLAHDRAG